MFRSQVDDRELRARYAAPFHFQAPNRSVGARYAMPAGTRLERKCVYEMEALVESVSSWD